MDSIITSPEALREAANWIQSYSAAQIEIIENYLSEVHSINGEWADKQYEDMLSQIALLQSKIVELSDTISFFPRFLNEKADILEAPPAI